MRSQLQKIAILTVSTMALLWGALHYVPSAFARQPQMERPTIGKKAPDFTLPNVMNGKEMNLYSIKDKKATVIMFIATQCPISNAYNERMTALAKEFQSKGVQFIGINSNHTEPTDDVIRHAKDNGFPFPVLKDEGNKVADRYAARVTPEVYVVDSGFVLRYHGRIDDNQDVGQVSSQDLKNALNAVLLGQGVLHPETKAFGCTIKRVR